MVADELLGGPVISTSVPALLAGVRVDRGVAMVANVSRATAAELVAAGRVEVDGTIVRAGRTQLSEGVQLTIRMPEAAEPGVRAEEGVRFEVVHADSEVAVVDKPAGLVVHPGAGHGEGTLVGGLLARFPEVGALVTAGVCAPDRPGIVHRLDKGTSGLLAVARTTEAYRDLAAQLAARTMERRYLALVAGDVGEDRGEVEAPIGRSARTPTKMAVTATGKPARTAYTVLERRGEQDAARAVPAEWADPSDPCPYGGYRPSRRRGRPLRRGRPAAGLRPFLPACVQPGLRPPADQGAPGVRHRHCPKTLRSYLE